MVGWYNDEARKLAQWSAEENNRIKASHIMVVAERMESRYLHSGQPLGKCPMPAVLLPPKGGSGERFIDRQGINNPPPYGSRPARTK
jgi:hypothetical protein